MSVLEQFKHADTFVQMSMSDKLAATGYVIVLGMGITFISLILIWWVTVLMSKTIQKFEAKATITEGKVSAAQSQAVVNPISDRSNDEDETLIAVISAAIAASMNTSVQSIKVTNIRRIADSTPTWGKSGRSDVMNARF